MVVLHAATTRSINDAGRNLDEIIYLDFQATTPLDPVVLDAKIESQADLLIMTFID